MAAVHCAAGDQGADRPSRTVADSKACTPVMYVTTRRTLAASLIHSLIQIKGRIRSTSHAFWMELPRLAYGKHDVA